MADSKLSALTAGTAISDADLFYSDQSATSVKVTGLQIKTYAAPVGANPTATGSDTAVNGTATTFMRSDGAPAIQKASSSQFGLVKVDGTTITASSGVISTGRQKLTSNTNYYVRSDGSDSNTGTANTAGGAWLTIQHAMDYLSANIDGGGFGITVNIGSGTFAGVGMKDIPGALWLFFSGAGLASTTLQDGPNDGTYNVKQCVSFFVPVGYDFFFDALTLARSTTVSGAAAFNVNRPVHVAPTTPAGASNGWGLTGLSSTMNGFSIASPGALFNDSGSSPTISGSFDSVYLPDSMGVLWIFSSTYTLSGTPSWNTAFARAADNSLVETFGATFTGTSTGKRYSAESGAIINTFGSGATYFPGNAGGTTDGIGVYI